MTAVLDGLTVIEGSAFVAAPLGGMTLAQLGADVIRFDQIGGGLDHDRWPLSPNGRSLFWAGLNKGKRSVQVDLQSDAGREIVAALVAAVGTFITNFPARGWLDYDVLRARRPDLVMVALSGNRDGTSEVDYTVNPATGFALATGPRELVGPVNNLLPAWDAILGGLAATGLLAAELHRLRTGEGTLVRASLSDAAFAMVGHLGRVADAELHGRDAPRDGNHLYGAFGHDFETRDGRRVMVVALTSRQWRALVEAAGSADSMRLVEQATGVDLSTEGGRYEARELLAAVLRPWFAARDLAEVRRIFTDVGVSWGLYQTFGELVRDDSRVDPAVNPMWEVVEQPGIGSYRMPGSPLSFSAVAPVPPRPAPIPGEHTEEVLSDVLGLTPAEIGRLADADVVRCAKET